MFEKILDSLTILFICFVVLLVFLVGYSAYGRLTQKEIITVQVINKDIYQTTRQQCTKIDNTMTCIPITTTHYRVDADNETFSTSLDKYEGVVVGKKHTFLVTGWPGDRYISRVLE